MLLGPVTIEAVAEVNTSTSVVIPRKTTTGPQTHKQLDKKIYHGCLADYFRYRPLDDRRRCQELAWHLAACKDYHRLQQVLAEPK